MGHISQEDLLAKVEDARKRVEVGALYHHYKDPDSHYVIEFVGLLEASSEPCVAYRALYGKGILWVRALVDFTEEVETETGKTPRFIKV